MVCSIAVIPLKFWPVPADKRDAKVTLQVGDRRRPEEWTMVGIQGIGGIPEPQPERPSQTRQREQAESSTHAGDGVSISNAAQAAANLIQAAAGQSEIREERVEAARLALERGDYRNPDVVSQVAERINRFL